MPSHPQSTSKRMKKLQAKQKKKIDWTNISRHLKLLSAETALQGIRGLIVMVNTPMDASSFSYELLCPNTKNILTRKECQIISSLPESTRVKIRKQLHAECSKIIRSALPTTGTPRSTREDSDYRRRY